MSDYLENDISKLGLDIEIVNVLKEKNIIFIKDLWKFKRTELKKNNLKDLQINNIIIALQLRGLDLNEKLYK